MYFLRSIATLHQAIRDLEIVQYLVMNGADINAQDNRGNTPLHEASRFGWLEIAQCLVTNGATINPRNYQGEIPFHIAVRHGYLEIVQCLVMNGADINAKYQNGYTPLHLAACNGYLEIVQCLVMNGADINAKYLDDYTPLHLAACNGYLEIVQCLVMNGADINTENNAMFTPLQKLLYHEDISIWVKDLLTNNRKCTECRRWTLIGKLKNEVCFECQWQRIRLLWIAKWKETKHEFGRVPNEIIHDIIKQIIQ